MIGKFDKNSDDIKGQIDDIVKEMQHLSSETSACHVPGQKIHDMMQDWGSEFLHGLDTSKAARARNMFDPNEFWKTLDVFEQELRGGATGYDLHIQRLKEFDNAKMESIKNNAQFRIEALERALNETKMELDQMRE